jgi:hypothetical protein
LVAFFGAAFFAAFLVAFFTAVFLVAIVNLKFSFKQFGTALFQYYGKRLYESRRKFQEGLCSESVCAYPAHE